MESQFVVISMVFIFLFGFRGFIFSAGLDGKSRRISRKRGAKSKTARRKVVSSGRKRSADSPRSSEPEVVSIKFQAKEGPGLRKKKLKKKRSMDEELLMKYVKNGEAEDDFNPPDSFMVEPRSASEIKDKEAVDFESHPKLKDSKKIRGIKVDRPDLDSTTKPEFGESLQVGFKKRSSRKRPAMDRSSETEDQAGETASSTEVVVSDVDDDSYIEWDSKKLDEDKGVPIVRSSDSDDSFSREETLCRNCHEPLPRKYIKHFIKRIDDEESKVTGPFCSKMCSMEYSD